MARALVLGAGMVGSVIAADIAADERFEVTIADRSDASLQKAAARCAGRISTTVADLSDPAAIRRLAGDADIVLGALASHLGYDALAAVIDAGKPYSDISFMAENALDHDAKARAAGVTCVVDIGVAPGMSNLLAGAAAHRMDQCDRIEIYVGGLPVERRWPFQYKAGFAPADVIEEYTRPSRIVERGEIVVRPALTEPELLDFPHIGTLEAVNTDGLRTLADTLDVPNMVEKTLRYPGHYELMRVFRATGLFSKEPIEVGGQRVIPLEVTSALMFPKWTYEEGERDLTVMAVIAEGVLDGKPTRLRWDLYDEHDAATNFTSMSRTTAFPCAIVARLLHEGKITTPGVLPPEKLGAMPGVLETVMDELRARGVRYTETVEAI
jgi:saccharopine dehydrogenase-like NADP-dependent oxidoreductase